MILDLTHKVALVTGAARRIGAVIVRALHAEGMNLVVHYRSAHDAAAALRDELEGLRPGSVALVCADLLQDPETPIEAALQRWGRLDVLINNASTFYPTPLGTVTEVQWEQLLGSNLRAPFFLTQAAGPHLAVQHGCVVNIVDIHGDRPLKSYPVYSIAKAGLAMLTRSLARELGPEVRVNAVAPGAILWPQQGMDDAARRRIVDRTALKRQGTPEDISAAVLFLIRDAAYVTGQIITVDGGRTLSN